MDSLHNYLNVRQGANVVGLLSLDDHGLEGLVAQEVSGSVHGAIAEELGAACVQTALRVAVHLGDGINVKKVWGKFNCSQIVASISQTLHLREVFV